MRNITVLGWYNHHNIGDEFYKTTFPKLYPDCNFTFTDKLTKFTDEVFLGGGNVLSKDFLLQLTNVKNKSIVSVSAFSEFSPDWLYGFRKIYVRDFASQRKLANLGIKSEYLPDLAFLLEPNKKDGKDFIIKLFKEEDFDLYEKVITVVMNAHLYDSKLVRDEYHFQDFCIQFANLVDNFNASFIFLPFSNQLPYDDRVPNSIIASKCKFYKKNMIIYEKLTPSQTLNIVAASDAVIATRLHALIFSCLAGVPFIDLAHHDKTAGFLETIGWQDWSLSYWNFDAQKCKELLRKAIEFDGQVLQQKSKEQRVLLEKAKKYVCVS